jgi:hypothetical protein
MAESYTYASFQAHFLQNFNLHLRLFQPMSCRGLTRAIYILSIEYLRMMCLSGDSNPGPPALQASTL